MIPNYDKHGNLPPGIWDATIEEARDRFANKSARRALLFEALGEVLKILSNANCTEIYLNGSFITDTEEPGDYDLCYDPTGMKATDRWREFLKLTMDERKKRHLGDIFINWPQPPFFTSHVDLWQTDRDNNLKGIIRIKLEKETSD